MELACSITEEQSNKDKKDSNLQYEIICQHLSWI